MPVTTTNASLLRFATLCAVACIAFVGPWARAHAAPNDGYALSNDAALRGGAALVFGRDAASVWYNPASAAATQRFRFDASATAYGLRLTRARSALEAEVDGRTVREPGREDQTQVVPTAAAAAFAWPNRNFGLALSFHTPIYSDVETRLRLVGHSTEGDYDFEQQSNSLAIARRHHFGLTLAGEAAGRLRFGATLGALFDKDLSYTHYNAQAGYDPPGPASEIVADREAASRVIGLELALGVQAQLGERVHAGGFLRTPAAVVWLETAGSESTVVSTRDGEGLTRTNTETDNGLARNVPGWLTPVTVATGIGVDLDRGMIELDAEASPSKQGIGQLWRRQPVWNVRLGGSWQVAPRWQLGSGLFTDRTTQPSGGLFPTVVLDRWGTSFAVRHRSGVRLARSERVRRIVFATTVAVRYAFGVGWTNTLRTAYAMAPQDATFSTSGRSRVTQHLISLHVGTGMSF